MDATQTHLVHDFIHESPLISCRFDPSGRYLFAGAQDFRVCRWRLEDGGKATLPTGSWVRGMAFTGDGSRIITGGTDGRLMWFPVDAPATGESNEIAPLREISAHDGWIRTVATSPDGKLIASAGNDQVVRLWNETDGTLVRECKGHESHIYNLAFHPGGGHLVSGDLHANLIDWDLETGQQVRTWKAESLVKFDKTFLAYIGGFRGLAFNADGTRLAGGGMTNVTNAFAGIGNPSIVVFDWEKGGAPLIEHLTKGALRGVIWGLAYHPTGTLIGGIGGQGGYLHFWAPDQAEEYHQMKLPDTARDLALAPDSLRVATAHFDGHARVHRMTEKEKDA